MSRHHIWIITLVIMIVLMQFPIPSFSEDPHEIKADPSMIEVVVKKYSLAQTVVTLKSTISVNKTIIFQNKTDEAYPSVDLYGQSIHVPANSYTNRSVVVDPGKIISGSFDVTLNFYFQNEVGKGPIGNVIFHITIIGEGMAGWPLRADHFNLNVSVPEGMSILREITLTNMADVPIKGKINAPISSCMGSNMASINILGDSEIDLDKNESTKIKVEIHGASISSSTCDAAYIYFSMNNGTIFDTELVVIFHIQTTPGTPLIFVLICAAAIIVIFIRVRFKKKERKPLESK